MDFKGKLCEAKWAGNDGKADGPMRNAQMLAYAKEGIPALVAFWDGKSRGTDNMIQAARRGKAFVRVIPYEAADVKKTERKP